jgi:hypothetical protein
MESKTAKKRYCSEVCRVYYNREVARGSFTPPQKEYKINIPESKKVAAPEYFEPEKVKSFQDYLRDISGLELEEDCKDWVVTVKADSNLTPNQKYQLTERLRMKWIN